MLYGFFKAVHLLDVAMLLGNAVVTLIWKLAADRTGDPRLIAFAQRLVTLTDWLFTVGGVVLIALGGYGAVWVGGLDPFTTPWLLWGQALVLLSGALWAGILVPAQIRQARQARVFASGDRIPPSYWHDARRWVVWGIAAIVPLVIAVWVMSVKPG